MANNGKREKNDHLKMYQVFWTNNVLESAKLGGGCLNTKGATSLGKLTIRLTPPHKKKEYHPKIKSPLQGGNDDRTQAKNEDVKKFTTEKVAMF